MSINYNEKFYNWFWDYAATRGVKPVNPPADKGKTILFSTNNLEKAFGIIDPSGSPRKLRNVALYGLDLGKDGTTCYFYLCLTAKQGVTTESEIADREKILKKHTGIEKSLINEKTGAVKPNVYCNLTKANTYAPEDFTKENLEKETIEKMIDALVKQDEKWFSNGVSTAPTAVSKSEETPVDTVNTPDDYGDIAKEPIHSSGRTEKKQDNESESGYYLKVQYAEHPGDNTTPQIASITLRAPAGAYEDSDEWIAEIGKALQQSIDVAGMANVRDYSGLEIVLPIIWHKEEKIIEFYNKEFSDVDNRGIVLAAYLYLNDDDNSIELTKIPAAQDEYSCDEDEDEDEELDYEKMDINTLISFAEQGDEMAQHYLGIEYKEGDIIAQDSERAFYWLAKAAASGLAGSQSVLRDMILEDIEFINDDENFKNEVEKLITLAIKGDSERQARLATLLQSGDDGIKANKEIAYYLYTQSAENGDVDAQFSLGLIYFEGDGIPKNLEKAAYWFTKAAEQGDDDAKRALFDVEMEIHTPEECRSCDSSHKWLYDGDCASKDMCGKEHLKKREPNEKFIAFVNQMILQSEDEAAHS